MEEEKNEYEENTYRILRMDLAFEDYEDHTGNYPKLLSDIVDKINYLRCNREKLSINEALEKQRVVLKECNEFLDMIGRDKFTFYDDGDINYNWDDELLKGEENGKR